MTSNQSGTQSFHFAACARDEFRPIRADIPGNKSDKVLFLCSIKIAKIENVLKAIISLKSAYELEFVFRL